MPSTMRAYSDSGADQISSATRNRPAAQTQRVLIVDRDVDSAQALGAGLAQSGFAVTTLGGGEDPVSALEAGSPHLVILDWDLPSVMTMTILRCASRYKALRLMAISTHAGDQQVAEGLDLGLDDYVIRPYSLPELLARVRALLRPRSGGENVPRLLEFHGLRLETADARVVVSGHRVHLRAVEFRLLEFLMRNPERAFSRNELLNQAWGRDRNADQRAVDVTVQRIRKALQAHNWSGFLQTVRGVGYRLSATPEAKLQAALK